MLDTFSLKGNAVITPQKIINKGMIKIKDKNIEDIGTKADYHIDLKMDTFIFPALINVHDHLRGDYLPKIGPPPGTCYIKCHDWEKDLRVSGVVKERAKISEKDCYFLGAYKNLFSGAATVQDHYPHKINDLYIHDLPIRVIANYTIHHEASSHSLPWGDGIKPEHTKAQKLNCPFIVHLEEGFDVDYQSGVELLEKHLAYDNHNLNIHCIGFSDQDIKKTKNAGCSVVWCPASNIFMYNLTCKIKKIMNAGINVSLGTDSTATGSLNLLEEMKFARKIYRKMYGEDLAAQSIVDMVTVNPARALKIQKNMGTLKSQNYADILVIKALHDDPYEALLKADMNDIILLTLEGKPLYGLPEFEEFFTLQESSFSKVSVKGQEMLVEGDPVKLLKNIQKAVGYKKILDFMPLDL
jgi:5-methylthioadenosine/S-adenosylhomocysteine deaminase